MTKMNRHSLSLIILMTISATLSGNSPVGHWLTFDEKNGDTLSIVEIYETAGKLNGRISRVFPRPHQGNDGICVRCKGGNRNARIIGLLILQHFKKGKKDWKDGRILDPASGKSYRASANAHSSAGITYSN